MFQCVPMLSHTNACWTLVFVLWTLNRDHRRTVLITSQFLSKSVDLTINWFQTLSPATAISMIRDCWKLSHILQPLVIYSCCSYLIQIRRRWRDPAWHILDSLGLNRRSVNVLFLQDCLKKYILITWHFDKLSWTGYVFAVLLLASHGSFAYPNLWLNIIH